MKPSNLIGMTFTRLTPTERIGGEPPRWETRYVCACSCGATVVVKHGALQSGNTKSCGCIQRRQPKACVCGCGQIVKPGDVGIKGHSSRKRPYGAIYKRLENSSRERNLGEHLTYEEFLSFVAVTNCHYCGCIVEWTAHNASKMGSGYNLDRKDNDQGYTKDNLVVCCVRCNRGKGKWFTYDEWSRMAAALI